MQNDLSLASLKESGNMWCPGNAGHDYMVEDAFCGKVSVAVADAGETAMVVSMVPRDLQIEMPNESPLNIEVDEAIRRESMALVADANTRKVETETVENGATDPEPAAQNVVLSLSQDTFSVIPPANELSTSGSQDVIGKLFCESNLGMKTSECKYSFSFHLVLSIGSFSPVISRVEVQSMPSLSLSVGQNSDEAKAETDDATNNQTSQEFSQTTLMEDSTLDGREGLTPLGLLRIVFRVSHY